MGMSLDTKLFYGIHLGDPEAGDAPECLLELMTRCDYDCAFSEILGENSLIKVCTTHYYDTRDFYLIVTSTEHMEYDGAPQTVTELPRNPSWDISLKEACEKLKIPYKKPHWLVGCSYW